MRTVSRFSPAPVCLGGPGALFRLTVCLAMLHACGHAASEAANGGYEASAAVERSETHPEGMGSASGGGSGFVVEHGDGKLEGDGGASGHPIVAVRKATQPVDEVAGDVLGEPGEVSGQVGECSGRRFKKCR